MSWRRRVAPSCLVDNCLFIGNNHFEALELSYIKSFRSKSLRNRSYKLKQQVLSTTYSQCHHTTTSSNAWVTTISSTTTNKNLIPKMYYYLFKPLHLQPFRSLLFFLAILSFSVLLTVFKVIRQPPQCGNKLGHREQTVQRNPKDGSGSTPRNARCRRKDESIWAEAEAIARGR